MTKELNEKLVKLECRIEDRLNRQCPVMASWTGHVVELRVYREQRCGSRLVLTRHAWNWTAEEFRDLEDEAVLAAEGLGWHK